MPTLADLLATKGSDIHTVPPSATVMEAIHRMNEHKIGAVLVMSDERLLGIFTERDVLRRVIAETRTPNQVPVHQVMTDRVVCCSPETDVEEASEIMKERRLRHLPVCASDGTLLGLISIGDLNAFYANTREQHISQLTDYIYGRA